MSTAPISFTRADVEAMRERIPSLTHDQAVRLVVRKATLRARITQRATDARRLIERETDGCTCGHRRMRHGKGEHDGFSVIGTGMCSDCVCDTFATPEPGVIYEPLPPRDSIEAWEFYLNPFARR